MTRPTLIEQLDSCYWSEDALRLFQFLTDFSPNDEGVGVTLVAAAAHLARMHSHPDDKAALRELSEQFHDLILDIHTRLDPGAARPVLRVVAGTDHNPNRKEV